MRISRKTAALTATLIGVTAFVVVDALDDKQAVREPRAPAITARGTAPTPPPVEVHSPQRPALPERAAFAESGSALFATRSWEPPPPRIVPQRPLPPPKPTAPPMPFKFVGRMVQDGRLSVFLAKGDAVIIAKLGDTLDGVYRIDSLTESEIGLIYVPLGEKQTIPVVSSLPRALSPALATGATTAAPVSAALAAARPGATAANGPASGGAATRVTAPAHTVPAQFRWGGPDRVKLGTRFEVTLNVKSDELLHAWPMQLRFDPTLFDVITVKPGRSVGDPNFDYRVNEDGSIYVGGSAQGGTRATNVELLVLTLMPVKPAPSAELSVTALNLQGPAGRQIAYDRIVAYKTAIAP